MYGCEFRDSRLGTVAAWCGLGSELGGGGSYPWGVSGPGIGIYIYIYVVCSKPWWLDFV